MKARITLVQTYPEAMTGRSPRRIVLVVDGDPVQLDRLAVLEAKRLHGPGTVWHVVDRMTGPS